MPSRRLLLIALPLPCATLLLPAVAGAQPCCGAITPNGQRLLQRLDASGVDHLWLPHKHVNWETGEIDITRDGRPSATHCSAFAAAFAKQLGIYILRPPEHSPMLLANAQMRWLSFDGASAGWRRLPNSAAAQQGANLGNLVVAVFENPDRAPAGPHRRHPSRHAGRCTAGRGGPRRHAGRRHQRARHAAAARLQPPSRRVARPDPLLRARHRLVELANSVSRAPQPSAKCAVSITITPRAHRTSVYGKDGPCGGLSLGAWR